MKNQKMSETLNMAFKPVPKAFHARVEETLESIQKSEDKQNMKGTLRKTFALVAAAVLLLGTALAVGANINLMDTFIAKDHRAKPLDNAETNISKNLGSFERDGVVYAVQEGVYDGNAIRLLLSVQPKQPDNDWLVSSFIGEYLLEDEAPVTGKNVIDPRVECLELDSGADSIPAHIDNFHIEAALRSENGGYYLYMFAPVESLEAQPAEKVCLLIRFESIGCICFELPLCQLNKAFYTSAAPSAAGVTINSTSLTRTPFASYLEIDYTFNREDDLPSLDKSATYYGTKNGLFLHLVPDCSGMRASSAYSYEEAQTLMNNNLKEFLCPVCGGADGSAFSEAVIGEHIDFSIRVSVIASTKLLNKDIMYYGTKGGRYLHIAPDCSGLENAVAYTYEEALKIYGVEICPATQEPVTLCPICEGDMPAQELSYWGARRFENGSGMHFTKTYIFDAAEDIPETITLDILKKGVLTGSCIQLDIVKSSAEAS